VTETEERVESALHYWVIWVVLCVLTGLTYLCSRFDMGSANVGVALAFALAKSGIVLVYFMHFLKDKGSSRLTIAVAVALVLLLGGLSISDVRTRFPPSVAGESTVMPARWNPSEAPFHPAPMTPLQKDLVQPNNGGH